MKEFSAIIIEDEKDHSDLLKYHLKSLCEEINLIGEARNVNEAKLVLKKMRPDIIFLDMNLEGKNSFRVLEKLAYLHEIEIIIISSHTEYAVEAFKHLVTDYLLKPLKPESLVLAVKKAKRNIELSNLASQENDFLDNSTPLKQIAIPSTNEVQIVPVDQVLYLESDGRYTIFHLEDKTTKMASKNIGEYEKLLTNNHFFRIHHSLLVNMNFAVNIHKKDGNYLRMKSQKYLPISKRKVNSLYRFLKLK
ncbi:response regulator transcription factor [Aggregatimonas sangjinii]|uniref:Response regulator transcription factor n=1 Tax=Aggregatimonas sangjinii TaxID=2583587 RepID=A0A5B7SU91_9FLAO|nr:LytTR family DNA-binding domain-containing protein [Aggregatimonas sangjinii]QCX00673.1 response regulator transcription factor [Aggregatimonas sangjinii]